MSLNINSASRTLYNIRRDSSNEVLRNKLDFLAKDY